MEFLERLNQQVDDKYNGVWNRLAKAANIKPQTLQSIKQGTEPKAYTMNRISSALKVSSDWLLMGEGEASKSPALIHNDELANIPEYDVCLSAGFGAYPADHALAIGFRPFSIKWLHKKGLNIKDLHLVRVQGDSMEPLLRDKDIIMLDTSKTKLSEAMPFAIRLDDELLVKTIQKQGDGNIALVSRNKAYNDITINQQNPPHDFQIIGAVVWHAHSWI